MLTYDTHKSTWQGQWHCIISEIDFYFNLRLKEMALKFVLFSEVTEKEHLTRKKKSL